MRRRSFSTIKEEWGVYVVESSFVFPLIFIIFGVLIMISIYSLQKVIITADVERAAMYISRAKSKLNEFEYRKNSTFGPNFSKDIDEKDVVNSLNRGGYLLSKTGGIPEIDLLDKKLELTLKKHMLISTSKIKKDIKYERTGIRSYIVVKVDLEIVPPKFIEIVKLDSLWKEEIIVKTIVLDQVSFVQDVDFIIDYATYFKNHLQLDEKFSDYQKKIQEKFK